MVTEGRADVPGIVEAPVAAAQHHTMRASTSNKGVNYTIWLIITIAILTPFQYITRHII